MQPPTPSRYTFSEPSSEWPAAFEMEAGRLAAILGDNLVAVHHIGSTSVPGLAAKPIIDLLPLVRSLADVDAATPRFEEEGYLVRGEFGLPGRRYFTRDRDGVRTHNIHTYRHDDPEADRHLAFCAFLREHDDLRDEYAALKREVYARHPDDIAAYNDGKDAWIKRVERDALAWYRSEHR